MQVHLTAAAIELQDKQTQSARESLLKASLHSKSGTETKSEAGIKPRKCAFTQTI